MKLDTAIPENWWHPSMKFFGKNEYMIGDNSIEGYLPGKNEALEARTAREADGAVRLAGLKERDSILDVPCGYGRHSIHLAKRGYNVTGLDINTEHLDAARQRASGSVRFLQRDMRDIGSDLYGHFDAVVNLTLSFGFFGDDDNIRTAQQFYDALKDGGKLVLHSDVSPEILAGRHYKTQETRTLRDGRQLRIDEWVENERLNGIWTIVDGKDEKQLTPYSVQIYSADEFRELFKIVGFSDVKIYGSFEGEKFGADSREIIGVGRK